MIGVGVGACVADDDDGADDGVTTTTQADGADGDEPGSTAGGDEAGTTADAGEEPPPPTPPGPCIEIASNPVGNCDEACAPDACFGGCWGVGQIGAFAAYYTSEADCEADAPVVLQATGCETSFNTGGSFFQATHVRCCCGI